eukprot:11693139-Alexandrium_andersonii.AAC.1
MVVPGTVRSEVPRPLSGPGTPSQVRADRPRAGPARGRNPAFGTRIRPEAVGDVRVGDPVAGRSVVPRPRRVRLPPKVGRVVL